MKSEQQLFICEKLLQYFRNLKSSLKSCWSINSSFWLSTCEDKELDRELLEIRVYINIVNYLNKSGELLSSVGVIIIGIKDLLRGFTNGRVQHVPRMGNQAAYTLAQHAKGYHDNCSWRNKTPMFLQATLNNDIRLMQSTAYPRVVWGLGLYAWFFWFHYFINTSNTFS